MNSSIVKGAFILCVIAIAGTGYYLNGRYMAARPPTNPETTWTTLKPHAQPRADNARNVPDVSAGTSRARTDTPIKCHDPEVGEFWTNAATCAGADLNNRISIAEPLPGKPAEERYGGKHYKTPAEEAENSRIEP